MAHKNNTQRWNIPIQVTVTLGSPEMIEIKPATDEGGEAEVRTSTGRLAERLKSGFDPASLAENRFSWRAALSLALASKLSYENVAVVQLTAKNSWGLDACEFIEVDETQCFVASNANTALVAFRGSESLGDWLGNLNLLSTTRHYGAVHRGFLSAFQVVDSRIRDALHRLSGRQVLLTGHSLGGALATVAAAEWQGQLPIRGIYTYGQPAVGKGDFSNHIRRHYRDKYFRFVNDDDIVPQVPPTYDHVGKLIHFDANGSVISSRETAILEAAITRENLGPSMLSEAEFDQLRSQLLAQKVGRTAAGMASEQRPAFEGFFPSFRDHRIDNYIAKIASKVESA